MDFWRKVKGMFEEVRNDLLKFYLDYRKNKKVGMWVPLLYEEREDGSVVEHYDLGADTILFVRVIPNSDGSLLWQMILTGDRKRIQNGEGFYEAYSLAKYVGQGLENYNEILKYYGVDPNSSDEDAKKKAFGGLSRIICETIIEGFGIPNRVKIRGLPVAVYEAILKAVPQANEKIKYRVLTSVDQLNEIDFVKDVFYATIVFEVVLGSKEDVKMFLENLREILLKAREYYEKLAEEKFLRFKKFLK